MDFDGAVGELIGGENNGLKCMFTMMNNARLCVGLQGVALAERAYQHALAYANERVQGKSFKNGERVVIAHHADVRRMLLDMKARVTTGRLMAYNAALELDKAISGDRDARARVNFLTPIVKGWCTDMAVHVASVGIQIQGGMGFIEETGAAQYYRDARILPIYEGTNGIQAADFVFRKILRDDGALAMVYIKEMEGQVDGTYLNALTRATDTLISLGKDGDLDHVSWVSTPYLEAFSLILGGAMIEKAEQTKGVTESKDGNMMMGEHKFYRESILPCSLGILSSIL